MISLMRVVCPDGSTAISSPALDAAARDRAGKAAEIGIGTVDPLHRHAEGFGGAVVLDVDGFEVVEQMRPRVPGRARAARGDVVAVARRDRNADDLLEAEFGGEGAEAVGNLLEHGAVEIDEVDLVDRQHHVADA